MKIYIYTKKIKKYILHMKLHMNIDIICNIIIYFFYFFFYKDMGNKFMKIKMNIIFSLGENMQISFKIKV